MEYPPALFVFVLVVKWVVTSVDDTSVFAIFAPEASVTSPVRVPRYCWALSGSVFPKLKRRNKAPVAAILLGEGEQTRFIKPPENVFLKNSTRGSSDL